MCLTIYGTFIESFLVSLPLMLAHVYNSLQVLVLKCLGFCIVESVKCIHSLWVEFKEKITIFLFFLCCQMLPICYCIPSFRLFKTCTYVSTGLEMVILSMWENICLDKMGLFQGT